MREYNNLNKAKIQNETTEEREARFAKMREYNNSKKAKRQNETTEQRKARLAKMRAYSNSKKGTKTNETTEQREARLVKMREYKNSKNERKINETNEQREARLAKERERKLIEKKLPLNSKVRKRVINYSSHIIEVTTNPVSSCFANENIDELALLRKFHNSISAGPLYICTCCDQLWHKHSVSPADRLKLVNPEMSKYLQNVKSVDDIEWICQTCNNHLKKGRVPPCAIANCMQIPEKLPFFI